MIEAQGIPAQREGRIRLFHVAIVVLSLLLTITAWQFSKFQADRQVRLLFETSRDQALGLIVDRMQQYEDALWAGVAAVDSHGGDISFQAWQAFAQTLRIEKRHPGINGIGVTHYLTAQTLDAYLAKQRQDRSDFRLHPAHDQSFFMPITYIEPIAENAAAVGLDLAHEQNRRTAALASRDTGSARITGPITLVQDSDKTPGFLFYTPFYRDGPPDDLAGRHDRFLGTVYAPFVVHRLMEGLLAKELRSIKFNIIDDGELIYDEHLADDPRVDPDPMFSELVSLDLYGRNWTLDVRTDLTFRKNHDVAKPMLILIAGLFIEGLIIMLLFQMSRAKGNAVAYAEKVSTALREKSKTLAATNIELSYKNEELERFAYVASHDLKTPLRGIGGLTEMIQEDLEDYLALPSANPEIGENLGRIHDRVKRMNDLTRGILAYSQVGSEAEEDVPVSVAALIEALRLDFALRADQLLLKGDAETVTRDSSQFRRVMENLVGNAIKYHDGVRDVQIVVSMNVSGGDVNVSVADNGPGIPVEFHNRIFDVFQTLRTGSTPESTGIGLSIVKKAVELHGGKIRLSSSQGQGATFSFNWPHVADLGQSRNKVRAA